VRVFRIVQHNLSTVKRIGYENGSLCYFHRGGADLYFIEHFFLKWIRKYLKEIRCASVVPEICVKNGKQNAKILFMLLCYRIVPEPTGVELLDRCVQRYQSEWWATPHGQ
jgi:hypothetical protein